MTESSDSQIPVEANLTTSIEHNLRRLLKDVEKIRRASQPSPDRDIDPDPAHLSQFLERAQGYYEMQNYDACKQILQEGLKLAPGNPEFLSLLEKVRREHQKNEDSLDLANRVAKIKAEAIKKFEQGRYGECIERFKLLSELEPSNYDCLHYLEISQEEFEKQQSALLNHAQMTAAPINRESPVPGDAAPERQDLKVASSGESLEPSAPLAPSLGDEAHVSPRAEAPGVEPHPLLRAKSKDPIAEVDPEFAPKPPSWKLALPVPTRVEETTTREIAPLWKNVESEQPEEQMAEEFEDENQSRMKQRVTYLVGAGLVLGSLLGAWLALGPSLHRLHPDIQTPGESGQTKVNQAPPQELTTSKDDDLQKQAQKLFKQGKLLEANRVCETMLKAHADDSVALKMKQDIRDRLVSLAKQALADQHWEEAFVGWTNVAKVAPNDREALHQLKVAKINLKKQEQMILANKVESEKRIQELHQQISLAISSGYLLPPSAGNAMALIQQLQNLSPNDQFVKEKSDQVLRDLMAQANRSLQAKDYARAGALVRQIQANFPETSELKALQESIKGAEAHFADMRNTWLQKAEAAMAAGHFVTPTNDNVISYSNQLLALDPQNPKAVGLKKECSTKAGAQAKALIQEGKYDDAKVVYTSLLYLSQNDTQIGLNSQELKNEIDKLTYRAYPVIHDHTLGSCTGRLRFNGYQINYIPSTDSKDGFSLRISDIVQIEPGDKLKIQFKGKNYRFQVNTTKNFQDNRAIISEIQQRLNSLRANG